MQPTRRSKKSEPPSAKMKASSTRLRWFMLSPFDRKQLRKLADGMLTTKFDEETGFGFILGDVRKDKITGRFVKRETVTRSVTDPQGDVQNIQFTVFSTVRFTFTTDLPNLELVNPPRRLLEFITAIGDLLDNKVAILPAEATCGEWLDALAKSGCTVRPTKIVTGNIALSDTVVVKAAFSGTRNVQKEALGFLKSKKYDPVAIAGEIEFDGESAKLRITTNGLLTFLSIPSDDLFGAVRESCGHIKKSR
jgi:hypothetical protein